MKYLVLIIVMVCCTPALAQVDTPTESEREGYGKTLWGMSPQETKAAIDETPEEIDGGFAVETTVAGHPATVVYMFTQDKLTLVVVVFMDGHVESNHFLTDFSSVGELLSQKYGIPASKEWVWINDLYKDDPQDYGMALMTEKLIVYETWETEGSKIEHSLSGKNFDVIHKILYESKQHEEVRKEEQTEQHLDSL